MKLSVAAPAVIALVVFAAGCDRIPGTDSLLIAHGKKAAADNLIDPSSAQFRKLVLIDAPAEQKKISPKILCGEINGKNRQGAYAGFTRFVASTTTADSLGDPQETDTQEDVDRAMRRCQSKDPIYSEAEREYRLTLCEDAKGVVERHGNQMIFDEVWKATCGAGAK